MKNSDSCLVPDKSNTLICSEGKSLRATSAALKSPPSVD